MPPATKHLAGVMHAFVLHFHPFGLHLALNPVPVIALHLHPFGNPLKQISVSVPSVKLLLGLLLTPDKDEVPQLCEHPVVCLGGVSKEERMGSVVV